MTTAVDAVYQNGVFRPTTPPDLAEGTAVRLTIVSAPVPPDPAEAYRLIKAIADLPEEPGGDPTVTGRDHDASLYGGPKGVR
jgi:predicted DNA-binding antitoxin AbrB/MazE fold protein